MKEAVSVPALDRELPVERIPPVLDLEVGADRERRLADVERHRLADMDRAAIDMRVLSSTMPGVEVDLRAQRASPLARLANDEAAAIVAAHPDRFAGFAAPPLQDPAAAVAELHRAIEERGVVGALMNKCGPV